MSFQHISLVLRDRNEVEQLIADTFSRGRSWQAVLSLLSVASVNPLARKSWRVFCVQRHPQLLHDHTIAENWKLPLWATVADDVGELQWSLKQAQSVFAAYSSFSTGCYPTQLDEVSRVAAQFSLAHIVMPDVVLLDAVLSGWHQTDQELVWRMIKDYADRYPFRPMVYVDVAAPPSGKLSFHLVEPVWP